MRETAADISLVLLFAFLTAIGANIKIPFLPYHPNTPQLIPVILSGVLLGSYRGPLSQITFTLLGLLGAPLFKELAPVFPSLAGAASPRFAETGMKAGWLLGFIAAAYVAGKTIEFAQGYDWASVTAAVAGSLTVLYVTGLSVPVLVYRVSYGPTFADWLWPFFAADLAKCALVVFFVMNIRSVLPKPDALLANR